jgi:hypothetical protein
MNPLCLGVNLLEFTEAQNQVGPQASSHSGQVQGQRHGLGSQFTESEKLDATLINGDGIGAGVIGHIKHQGFTERLFAFHGKAAANDASACFNRRA